MKPSLLVPVLSALLGFATAWMLKPSNTVTTTPNTPKPVGQNSSQSGPGPGPQPAPVPGPGPAHPPPHIIAPVPATGTSSASSTKMLRLAEALGLSQEQQDNLAKLIADCLRPKPLDPNHPPEAKETLEELAATGVALDKALNGFFTPEQKQAFAALRQRTLENRIELKAQRELATLIELTDLSADQRGKILDSLRATAAAEQAAFPPALSLVLESSALPIGPRAMSDESVRVLNHIAETQDLTNPDAVQAKLIEAQRRALDARLAAVKDILTPAQLAQFQDHIAGQRALQDHIRPQRP